jgi:hypothetical protein
MEPPCAAVTELLDKATPSAAVAGGPEEESGLDEPPLQPFRAAVINTAIRVRNSGKRNSIPAGMSLSCSMMCAAHGLCGQHPWALPEKPPWVPPEICQAWLSGLCARRRIFLTVKAAWI